MREEDPQEWWDERDKAADSLMTYYLTLRAPAFDGPERERWDAPRVAAVVHAAACRVWRVVRPDRTTFVERISPPGTPGGSSIAVYPTSRRCLGVKPERLVDWRDTTMHRRPTPPDWRGLVPRQPHRLDQRIVWQLRARGMTVEEPTERQRRPWIARVPRHGDAGVLGGEPTVADRAVGVRHRPDRIVQYGASTNTTDIRLGPG